MIIKRVDVRSLAQIVAYAIMGFVGGLIGGWVFNNVCQSMGGLKVEVELARPHSPAT